MEDTVSDPAIAISLKWLKDLSDGVSTVRQGLEAIALKGLQVIEVRKGFIRCTYTVPSGALDENENWHVGAIATLIDDVGAAAISTILGRICLSVDFSISFYSAAKYQEEVEIVAEVAARRGKLNSVVLKVRRKDNGDMIALGRQWMVSLSKHPVSKL